MALMKINKVECEYENVLSKAEELWGIDKTILKKPVLMREEAAVLISTAMNISNENADISFMSDVGDISEYAYPSVASLYNEGVMSGKSKETINPKDTLTRAEAVTLLSRLP